MTRCPQCGAVANASQRFCGECGTRLREEAAPVSPDERNSVPRRPGGGRPDPWDIGTADTEENGEDDFFSRFRPKSAVGDEDVPPPTRRSRRRFNFDLDNTVEAPTETARTEPTTPPSVPPLFPQHTGETAAQRPQAPSGAQGPQQQGPQQPSPQTPGARTPGAQAPGSQPFGAQDSGARGSSGQGTGAQGPDAQVPGANAPAGDRGAQQPPRQAAPSQSPDRPVPTAGAAGPGPAQQPTGQEPPRRQPPRQERPPQRDAPADAGADAPTRAMPLPDASADEPRRQPRSPFAQDGSSSASSATPARGETPPTLPAGWAQPQPQVSPRQQASTGAPPQAAPDASGQGRNAQGQAPTGRAQDAQTPGVQQLGAQAPDAQRQGPRNQGAQNQGAQNQGVHNQGVQNQRAQEQGARGAQPSAAQTPPASNRPAQSTQQQRPQQDASRTGQAAPAGSAFSRPRQQEPDSGGADDATFTQLIKGLADDPADRPIVAPGFDQTGIVPLPSRMQEPQRSDAEKRAQSRAAEFYGTGPVGRNPAAAAAGAAAAATGPGEAGQRGDADAAGAEQPRPENPFLAAARAAEQSEQRPPERSGGMPDLPPIAPAEPVPGPAPQGSAPRPEPEAPEFTSPFVTEATTPQQARAARQPEPEEGFWPFGDEFQQEQSAPRRSEPQDDVDALFGAGTGAVGGGGSVGGGGAGGFGGGSGTGAGGGGGGSSDEASTKRNGVKLILIAAIAAIVIVIGAFALRPLFGGGADEASEPTTEQTEEQGQQGDPDGGETDSGEETPEPTEDAPEQFDPVAFQSGSGNLRCQIDPENGAVCQLVTVNFTPPAEQCESGAARGTTVGVGQEGITWPCLTGDLPGGEVVEYDVPITAGDYTCSINYTTGVTCENGKGDEFSLEFNSGVATTGETAGESQPEVSPIG